MDHRQRRGGNALNTMVKVTYIEPGGREHAIDATPDRNLMEVALNNSIPGIDGDCGGACACATCHVYVDEACADRIPAPSETEDAMLDFVIGRSPLSRLSCQIRTTADLDGLKIHLPFAQR